MSIPTKTIGELKGHRFFVDAYQRGYRWTAHEVNALLDDINGFSTEGDKRYCIQPLIVKLRDDGSYEVVDGQQRLTTIYIFYKIAKQELKSAEPPFKLDYETRENSGTFLESLSEKSELEENDIDYYHMALAYKTIDEWFDNKDKSEAIPELYKKIKNHVFFIWYELPPKSDPIERFTKVNLYKIDLTNAELIKALLLNKDNFPKDNQNRKDQISLAWEKTEQGLQDDSFWYFLNEKERDGTRIDMIFELLAEEYNKQLPDPIDKNQKLFPFLVFLAHLDAAPVKESFVKKLWDDVEKWYAEFREWYADLNKYHIIGYLLTSPKVQIADIFTLTKGKRKSEVMKDLISKAEEITGKFDLSKISYQRDNPKIRTLLLLFNIATLVCKSEKQYRFPFDLYKETCKGVKWDIEHIHATADDSDEPDDALWNLTLLQVKINRSREYAKEPFDVKREIILKRESEGLFVPVCTRNIFLKAYSKKLDDMDSWTGDDKKDYIAEMEKTLTDFFGMGDTK